MRGVVDNDVIGCKDRSRLFQISKQSTALTNFNSKDAISCVQRNAVFLKKQKITWLFLGKVCGFGFSAYLCNVLNLKYGGHFITMKSRNCVFIVSNDQKISIYVDF
jgi:hypothetical protein